MPLNINRLLNIPNLNPLQVQTALSRRFTVNAEPRNETFFTFQLRCTDDERTRLIVRYGYSVSKDRWFFEPIKGN